MTKCTGAMLTLLAAISLATLPSCLTAQKKGATPVPARRSAPPASMPPGLGLGPCMLGCWHAAGAKGKIDLSYRGTSAVPSEQPNGRSATIELIGEHNAVLWLGRPNAGLPTQGKYDVHNACPDSKGETPKGAFVVQLSPRDDQRIGVARARSGVVIIESSTKTRVTGRFSLVLCFIDGATGTLEGTFDARNPF